MYIPGVQRLQVDTEGPKQGPKRGSTAPKTTKNHRSLARCNLECEAEMAYEAVTKCHFLQQIFKNFELKMHIAVVQRLQGEPEGQKEGQKDSFRTPKNYLNLTV